jgi:dTDP-L-rhamnose 4-epimerase
MAVFVVTGGAGFIGSHIVDQLVDGAHDVRVVDCLDPSAHGGRPTYLNSGATYVEADVADLQAWGHVLEGVDGVCHQAAKVGLGLEFCDIEAYVKANDVATAALLRALYERRFTGRLVLASSMVVYGEGRYTCAAHGVVRPGPRAVADLEAGRFEPRCPACGWALEPSAVPEDAPVDPRTIYAATKLHQEHLCAVFGREAGVGVTVLRYHNVYGPRMPRDTPYAGVASIFRSAYAAGQPPAVFEDGRQRRDFVHVHDVARANVLALTGAEPIPGVFNIASGEPHTVGEMATALASAFGDGAPQPQVTGRYRLGDVRHVFASPTRAAAQLGFTASVRFAEGMREFATAPLRQPPRQPSTRMPAREGGGA